MIREETKEAIAALENWGLNGDERIDRFIKECLLPIEELFLIYRYKQRAFSFELHRNLEKEMKGKKREISDIVIKLRENNKINLSERTLYRIQKKIIEKFCVYKDGGEIKPLTDRRKFQDMFSQWATLGDSKIDKFMNGLNEEERNIIIRRYKKRENWLKVAQKLYISDRQIYRKYNKILEKLKVFLENYKRTA